MRAQPAGTGPPLLLAALALAYATGARLDSPAAGRIAVLYPEEGTVFPPDFAPPTFLWREIPEQSDSWQVEIRFAGDPSPLVLRVAAWRPSPRPLDPAASGPTNRPPELSPEERDSWAWKPEPPVWDRVRRRAFASEATIRVTGFAGGRPVSRGEVRIRIAKDPVGAPIFCRDVPLMPSETEKGIIKPLPPQLLPLVKWRLRYVDEPESRGGGSKSCTPAPTATPSPPTAARLAWISTARTTTRASTPSRRSCPGRKSATST